MFLWSQFKVSAMSNVTSNTDADAQPDPHQNCWTDEQVRATLEQEGLCNISERILFDAKRNLNWDMDVKNVIRIACIDAQREAQTALQKANKTDVPNRNCSFGAMLYWRTHVDLSSQFETHMQLLGNRAPDVSGDRLFFYDNKSNDILAPLMWKLQETLPFLIHYRPLRNPKSSTLVVTLPGAREQEVHRDIHHNSPRAHTLTLIVTLHNLNELNGRTRLFPISIIDEHVESSTKGDILLFDSTMLHGAEANISVNPRYVYVTYLRLVGMPGLVVTT